MGHTVVMTRPIRSKFDIPILMIRQIVNTPWIVESLRKKIEISLSISRPPCFCPFTFKEVPFNPTSYVDQDLVLLVSSLASCTRQGFFFPFAHNP